ncbi:MAG: Ppx/GppA family phosphatase [Leptospirales bacterium]|nr:Ppx/GppA family phosphatase [Leptospirales bacterium]
MTLSQTLAAIDLGTNSFHLVVVRFRENGKFEVIGDEKASVRLGSGAGDIEEITPEAMERGLSVLDRFVQIARSHGADLRAVATSALREARNREEFLLAARNRCQLSIEVVPGKEEARLIYLGVIQALPLFERKIFLIDIGGGSTEFIVGQHGAPQFLTSHKIGAIRLKDRFFDSEPLRPTAVEACRRYVRVEIGSTLQHIVGIGFEAAVASSGTAETLAIMAALSRNRGQEIDRRGLILSRNELDLVVAALLEQPTHQKRARLPGLDERRADIIVGGAILLQETCHALKIQSLLISPFALREGVIFDTLLRSNRVALNIPDIRRASAVHLTEQMLRHDPAALRSSKHIARLAEQIYLELRRCRLVQTGDQEQDTLLLSSAALLHNVGMLISHSAHHKHSYYIIKNSELLLGFSGAEIEIIAQIARYHRKAAPSRKHAEFALLGARDQQRVRLFSGILRLAVALDRGMSSRVESVDLELEGETLVFGLHAAQESGQKADIQLERWAAEEKIELLAESLSRTIRIA